MKDLVIKNRQKMFKNMKDNSLLVLFAGRAAHRSADQAYEFTPNRNFYYLTGLDREEFILVMSKFDGYMKEQLFITKPDPDIEKWIGIRMRIDEAKEASGIDNVAYVEAFPSYFNSLLSNHYFENIYVDTEYHEDVRKLGLKFAEEIREKHPHLRILSASNIIHELRVIKEKQEIEYMKKAIEITKHGIEAIMKNCRSGIYEKQLEAYYDFAIKYHLADSRSFKTIMASGKNATILHYEENNHLLEDGNLVLFDLGAEYKHYCSDITRTIPINGKFSPRQKEVYESVLRVNETMIKMIKPGLLYKTFLDTAKDLLAEECIKLGLITDKKDVGKYYYHGIGHFLGLDVHDVGIREFGERKFEPGMVVTVEPGLYIAEENIGVRIEDNVLVTEDGSENLSKDIIKSVHDIEAFMNR
ncbi:MAG TPA: aminopeptidase P family protein [Haloplasmataceae bacterium]